MKPMDYYEKYIKPTEIALQAAMFAEWFVEYIYNDKHQYTKKEMKDYRKMFDGILFQRYIDGLE